MQLQHPFLFQRQTNLTDIHFVRCVCVCVCVAAMKADRKRLKVEKADLVSQMQHLYTTLDSREDQLREFIRNYDQHRKVTRPTAAIVLL